ncbi:vegetative cell wall protein gp1-like isoform X2 [Pyrgilauda ruficollis]|uniref:vegetative cell wall protein gp1-like isoform X2 n=1 Tax=Pyrgilauda ruficollis TaxID=221976 RepID=UPI001B874DB8|nr:vegetative cell wall protein gp1-like isoform X2 [Pyrgilauda ruficollis]
MAGCSRGCGGGSGVTAPSVSPCVALSPGGGVWCVRLCHVRLSHRVTFVSHLSHMSVCVQLCCEGLCQVVLLGCTSDCVTFVICCVTFVTFCVTFCVRLLCGAVSGCTFGLYLRLCHILCHILCPAVVWGWLCQVVLLGCTSDCHILCETCHILCHILCPTVVWRCVRLYLWVVPQTVAFYVRFVTFCVTFCVRLLCGAVSGCTFGLYLRLCHILCPTVPCGAVTLCHTPKIPPAPQISPSLPPNPPHKHHFPSPQSPLCRSPPKFPFLAVIVPKTSCSSWIPLPALQTPKFSFFSVPLWPLFLPFPPKLSSNILLLLQLPPKRSCLSKFPFPTPITTAHPSCSANNLQALNCAPNLSCPLKFLFPLLKYSSNPTAPRPAPSPAPLRNRPQSLGLSQPPQPGRERRERPGRAGEAGAAQAAAGAVLRPFPAPSAFASASFVGYSAVSGIFRSCFGNIRQCFGQFRLFPSTFGHRRLTSIISVTLRRPFGDPRPLPAVLRKSPPISASF